MQALLQRFLKDENGATVVEYGLIVAVLSMAIIGGIGQAFNAVNWLFTDNSSRLANTLAAH
jgi:pilus assembly protein Flp/PilA